jgi:predicted O-methyltransferase YrrM
VESSGVRHALSSLKHRLLTGCGLATSLHAKELVYQQLFAWLCERNGVEKRFHPVRSAANHSLLWLVGRIVEENEPKRILELGAGQTTRLLGALARARGLQLVTLEHDAAWAAEVRRDAAHDVRLVPLVPSRLAGAEVKGYDPASLGADERFDLVVVDGPHGTRRMSRGGCLDLLERHLADDFVVVFDDAERAGERETIDRARSLLRARGRGLHETEVAALKRQVAFASDAFRRVAWY